MTSGTRPTNGRPPSVVGDSTALFAGNIAISAISYVGTAATARVLAPDDWGGLMFLLSLGSLLGFLFDFNVGRRVLVDALDAGGDASHVVGSFMGLRLVQGLIAYGALIAFVAVGPYPRSVIAAAAVTGSVLVLSSVRAALTVSLQLQLRFRVVALAGIVARLAMVALTFSLIISGTRSLLWFAVPHAVDAIVVLSLLWSVIRRNARIRPTVTPRRWAPWIKESLPIALGASIGIAYARIDVVMLSMLDGLPAVGLYSVGYKFCDLLAYVPAAVELPLMTLLVQAWPRHLASFQRNVRGAFILLATTGLALTAVFCLFAEPAITLVFGERYRAATDAARLLALGQGLGFVVMLYVTVLIAVGRHRLYPIVSVVGLATNVGLNAYLIPRHSYEGAALATVITEIVVLTLLGRHVRVIPGCRPIWWRPLTRALVATSALVAVGLVAKAVLPWPVAAMASLLAFAATLHAIGLDGPGGLRRVPHLLERVPLAPDDGEGAAGQAAPLVAAQEVR